MEQLLGDAKRLVQRLNHHDNSVDILISEVTNLQNKLIAMRQYRDEVSKLNDIADHRPRSTLILGSQLENERIQNLKEENEELSISLAEHQSALELIMNKYREQVLSMMQPNSFHIELPKNADQTIEMVFMKERIAEMARIMWESAAIDDSAQIKEIEFVRKLQVENENLRELLEISGGNLPAHSSRQQTSQGNPAGFKQVPIEVTPLENFTLHDNSASVKTENISADVKSMFVSENVNHQDANDFLNSFSMDKLKKRYGAKAKKNIFGDVPLPFEFDKIENDSDSTDSISDKDSIRNLKQLFNPPDIVDGKNLSNSSCPPSSDSESRGDYEKYFLPVDPSENCFRAIISDIKPLDFHVDMNEKLYDHDNLTETEDNLTETEDNLTETEDNLTETEDNLTETEENLSVIEDNLSETEDNLTKTDDNLTKIKDNLTKTEENGTVTEENVTGTVEFMTETEQTETVTEENMTGTEENVIETDENDENCPFFDDSTETSQVDDLSDISEVSVIDCLDSFDSIIEDAESSASVIECLDNFDSIIEDAESSASVSECLDNFDSIIGDAETSVIECLDNFDSIIRDAESSTTVISDDNHYISETIDDEGEVADFSSVKSEIHETQSNDEIKNRFQTNLPDSNENCDELDALGFLDDVLDFESDNDDDNNETEHDQEEHFLPGSNNFDDTSGKKAETNCNIAIDLKTKLIVSSSEDLLSPDCRTQNGEISDNQSEMTYTEDDIDQALSDFDSVLDLDDENSNNDSE